METVPLATLLHVLSKAVPVIVLLTFLVSLYPAWRWIVRHALRRRILARRVNRLACEVQVDEFASILDQRAQFRNDREDGVEHVFVLPDAFVQVITDLGDKVLRFAITTRSSRFKPTVGGEHLSVRLGESSFASVETASVPSGVWGWVGARRYGYSEAYYFGNPGNYQHYVVAANEAGIGGVPDVVPSLHGHGGDMRTGDFSNPPELEHTPRWLAQAEVADQRARSCVNTLAVTAPHADLAHASTFFGPDGDQVRIARSQ